MVTQQLLDYIKNNQQAGKSNEQITQELVGNGWKAEDVEHGFSSLASGVPLPSNTELPRAREIYKEAWTIYKNRIRTLLAIQLVPIIGYIVIILLGILSAIGTSTYIKNSADSTQPWHLPVIILVVVVTLALIYVGIWSTIAQLFAIKDPSETIGWKEAYKQSKPKIGMFFTTAVLAGLAIVGGWILLIIPGIIFGLWFSQYPYIVVEENLQNTSALKRSKQYVTGRTGQVFGKLFYMVAITIGLYIALGIVLAIINAVLNLHSGQTAWITNIFSFVWTPMVTVYGYQLYKHIKSTRP